MKNTCPPKNRLQGYKKMHISSWNQITTNPKWIPSPYEHAINELTSVFNNTKQGMEHMYPITRQVSDEGLKFVVANMNGTILCQKDNLKDAKKAAQGALKQDTSFMIFEAVCKVSPKPLDAEIEEL